MKCNACWTEIEPRTHAVASTCGHLFCVRCAESIVQSDGVCPVCEALITKNTVKVVTILQETADCKLHLCGQAPDTALNSALAAVNFYLKQQELHYQLRESQFKKTLQKMQEQCKKKLSEAHNGYQNAKRKYQQAVEQKHALERDNEELQQKYAQKAAQAKKLQEKMKVAESEPRRNRKSDGSRHSKQSGNVSFPSNLDPFKARTSPTPMLGLRDDTHPDEDLLKRQRTAGSKRRSGSTGRRQEKKHRSGSQQSRPDPLRDILGPSSNFAPPHQPKSTFLSKLGSPDGLASF